MGNKNNKSLKKNRNQQQQHNPSADVPMYSANDSAMNSENDVVGMILNAR